MRPGRLLFPVFLFAVLLATSVAAQVITGTLQGVVEDPTGAVVPKAEVTVTSLTTGATYRGRTNEIGIFSFPNLRPSNYRVVVEAPGFKRFQADNIAMHVGTVTPVRVTLELGTMAETLEVPGAESILTVDTWTAQVQGVLTTRQIDNLPLQGRNFLDLAQLEPGVQIRDGGDIDPTKNQMSAISVGGRSGIGTRIQVDGVDFTDEVVGTTMMNISQDAIQEFQVSEGLYDLSTDLTTSGAVNIITRSGGNDFHGSGFIFYRDKDFSAKILGRNPPFDREQAGFRLGGPFIRDKLFWQVSYEHNNQDDAIIGRPVLFTGSEFNQNFPKLVDETMAAARVDWNATHRLRFFARWMYNNNSGATCLGPCGQNTLDPFFNKNRAVNIVFGGDYSTGQWTHSARVSMVDFDNLITDATESLGIPGFADSAGRPITLRIGGQLNLGPNVNAPQETHQDNKPQFKYDGTYSRGRHIVRFGFNYNRISQGSQAAFFGLGPLLLGNCCAASQLAFADADPFGPGGSTNPLNFPFFFALSGNGLGFFSEKPGQGFPFGGSKNNRFQWYIADTWRVHPHVTLNAGLRYVFDTGIVNHDLRRDQLAIVPDNTVPIASVCPVGQNVLDCFRPGLGRRTQNDDNNFAPQLGLAWDVGGRGKLVVRSGAGIFYGTNLLANQGDRGFFFNRGFGFETAGIAPAFGLGLFDPRSGSPFAAGDPLATSFGFPNGTSAAALNPLLTGLPVGATLDTIGALQALFQTATQENLATFDLMGLNRPVFTDFGTDLGGFSLLRPDFILPYSFQFNLGVQYQIREGIILSADYLRQRGLHFPLVLDENKIGDARFLDMPTAQAAIGATLADFGVATIDDAIAAGATITDFAFNGLGACPAQDGCAFGGINRDFRNMSFIVPMGVSEYNGLHVNVRGRLGQPSGQLGELVRGVDFTVSYALGQLSANAREQELGSGSGEQNNAHKFMGPNALDRRHQLSFSSIWDLWGGFQFSQISHIRSAFPRTPSLPPFSFFLDEIFFTDLTGDGTFGDILPGASIGAFGRTINSVSELNDMIANFNSNIVGTFTPAAQALIDTGLFTPAQLQALGAVVNGGQPLPLAPDGQVMLDSFLSTDIRLAWKGRFWGERITVEPSVDIFNVFNFANYDPPGNKLRGRLDGGVGSINGTTNRTNPFVRGSGAFEQGIPRSFQFGLRISF
ncbi:MAG: carboxypeptidase regulatory-like domain-containing protein [Candidatus Acidoferrales bacterium]